MGQSRGGLCPRCHSPQHPSQQARTVDRGPTAGDQTRPLSLPRAWADSGAGRGGCCGVPESGKGQEELSGLKTDACMPMSVRHAYLCVPVRVLVGMCVCLWVCGGGSGCLCKQILAHVHMCVCSCEGPGLGNAWPTLDAAAAAARRALPAMAPVTQGLWGWGSRPRKGACAPGCRARLCPPGLLPWATRHVVAVLSPVNQGSVMQACQPVVCRDRLKPQGVFKNVPGPLVHPGPSGAHSQPLTAAGS